MGRLEEGPPSIVEPRVTDVASSCDVDGAEVERQPNQIVLQRSIDEFVDLIGARARNASDDRASRLLGIERRLPALVGIVEGKRIEEGLEEPQLAAVTRDALHDGIEVRVVAVDRTGQHRMTEAVHRLRELEADRGIHVGVESLEDILESGQRRRKLVEHDAVVLHLRAEPGGLEQPLTVPVEVQVLQRCLCLGLIRQ